MADSPQEILKRIHKQLQKSKERSRETVEREIELKEQGQGQQSSIRSVPLGRYVEMERSDETTS